jgi:protein-S-isoprenylcysteine O-methyltransferase Ste14
MISELIRGNIRSTLITMNSSYVAAIVVLFLIAVVVSVDLLFFRNLFWERLMVNLGIVLIFGAFYLRFLKHP